MLRRITADHHQKIGKSFKTGFQNDFAIGVNQREHPLVLPQGHGLALFDRQQNGIGQHAFNRRRLDPWQFFDPLLRAFEVERQYRGAPDQANRGKKVFLLGLASADDQNFIDLEANFRRCRDHIPFSPVEGGHDPTRLPKPPTTAGGKGN